ncbi:3397_t:CDS:2, partial [Dentiscutata heterogama]
NENGEIIERAKSGIIQTKIKIVTTVSFYVLDKGFALAYGGDDSPSNLNNSTVDISTGSTNGAYIIFYYFETNKRTGPFLLYQTSTKIIKLNGTIQTLTLEGIMCSVEFSGAGNTCFLLLKSEFTINNKRNITTSQNVMLKMSYLSSGSVTKIGEMKNGSNDGYSIEPLQFGGFLMLVLKDDLFGYILDENGEIYRTWSLPKPINFLHKKSIYTILANNSIVVVDNQDNSTWKVLCDDLFKFGQASTNPALGSRVNESTTQLYLSFTYPVILSSSNISIYQRINGTDHDLLRQRFQVLSQHVVLPLTCFTGVPKRKIIVPSLVLSLSKTSRPA